MGVGASSLENLEMSKENPKSKTGGTLWFPFVVILLVSLVFLLFFNQFVTLKNFSEFVSPFYRWIGFPAFLDFLSQYGNRIFSDADRKVFFLIIFLSAMIAVLEWRKRILQTFIESRSFSDRSVLIAIVLTGIVALRFFLAPGSGMYRGDSPYFLFLGWMESNLIRHFHWTEFWTFVGGGGQVLNQFYSPLMTVIVGIWDIVVRDFHLSAKLMLLTFRILMAVGLYLFVRQLTASRKAGFLAALAILLIHQMSHTSIYPGRYSAAAGMAVIPFLFYFFERYLSNRKLENLIAIALTSAVLVLVHLKTALPGFGFFGFYVFLRSFSVPKDGIKVVSLVAFFLLLGVLMDSMSVYGYFFEQKFAAWGNHLSRGGEAFASAQNPFLSYFLWNNFRVSLFSADYSQWQGGYLGLSILLAFLLSVMLFVPRKSRRFDFLPTIICTMLAFLFTFVFTSPELFKHFFLLQLIGTEKFMLFFALFGAATFGVLFTQLVPLFFRIAPTRLFLFLAFILVLDFGFTTFQAPFMRDPGGSLMPVIDFFKKKYAFDKSNGYAPFRVLLAAQNHPAASDDWRNSDMWAAETAGVPTVVGHYVENNYRQAAFLFTLNHFVQLHGAQTPDKFPEYLVNGLYLVMTGFFLTSFPIRHPQIVPVHVQQDYALNQMRFVSPILVSERLKRYPLKEFLEGPEESGTNHLSFLKGLEVDYAQRRANHIAVGDDYLGETNLSSLNRGAPLEVSVPQLEIGLSKVVLKIVSDNACFCRLAFTHYPFMEVRINGKRAPFQPTLEGAILVRITEGENEVEIIPHLSPARRIAMVVGIALFLLLLLVLWRKGRNVI
jgi:hypothetical protein